MEIIRYIFFILILICSTSIGFLISSQYVERVKDLDLLERMLQILQDKIRFTKIPLPEIMEELSRISRKESISNLFYNMSKKMRTEDVHIAWEKAINEEKNNFYWNKEDVELIKSFGTCLGKTDVEGQINELAQMKVLINGQVEIAKEERNKNEKMYKSLGTIIGIAIVTILF